MKTTLLKVALAASFLTVSANSLTAQTNNQVFTVIQLPGSGLESVSELEEGTPYLIYDSESSRSGFLYIDSEANYIRRHEANLSSTEMLPTSYIWIPERAGQNWKFKSQDSGNLYIAAVTKEESSGSGRNQGINSTGEEFAVTYDATNAGFKIKNTCNNLYWNSNASPDADLAGWETGHPFKFIKITDDMYKQMTSVTFTYPAFNNETLTMQKTVEVGTSLSDANAIPSPMFFTTTGINEADKTVTADNNHFTVNGSWHFPFEPNKVYRIDTRKSANLNCTNLFYNSSSKKVETRNTTNSAAFVPERLFYLSTHGFDSSTGFLKVSLRCVAALQSEGLYATAANSAHGTFTTSPTEFFVVTNNNGSDGVSLRHPDSTTAHVNDISGTLGIYNTTDADTQNGIGSFLRFIPLTENDFSQFGDSDLVNAAKESHSATDIRNLFPMSVTINYPQFSGKTYSVTVANVNVGTSVETLIPAAPSFFTSEGIQQEDKTVSASNCVFNIVGTWTFPFTLNTAYRVDVRRSSQNNCTNFFYNTTTKKVETKNANNADAFVAERLFYLDGDFNAAGQLIVSIHSIAADSNTGFNLSSHDNNTHGTFTTSPTLFQVVSNNNGTEGISLQFPGNTTAHVNDIDGTLGIYNTTEADTKNDFGSFLRFKALSDQDFSDMVLGAFSNYINSADLDSAITTHNADAVRACLSGYGNIPSELISAIAGARTALSEANNVNEQYPFGTGLGQYSHTEIDECIDALTLAINNPGSDAATITAATQALNNAASNPALNMPTPGRFYRFQNVGSGMYLSGNVNGNRLQMIADADGNSIESIFYLDSEGHLVALQDGKVLGDFDEYASDPKKSNTWKTLYVTNANAARTTFGAVSALGKYFISPQSGRYLHGQNSNVDCATVVNENAYYWTITQVDLLPIKGSDIKYAAIYSPVALNIADGMTVYSVDVQDSDKAVKSSISGNEIPANTPVLLQFDSNVDRPANGLVYLEPNYSDTATLAAEASNNALSGSIYAQTKQQGMSYFTTQRDAQTDSVQFYSITEEAIPGFAATITVESANVPQNGYFEITESTTGINTVETPDSNTINNVYDLQGRRVRTPGKGIYIIDGRKVFLR